MTFLFTDVESSTRLWDQEPEAMRAALAAHDRILRSVIKAHEGYIFSTAGDAFSAAFWTPSDAVEAALELQRQLAERRWPKPLELRVRMGLHTGTADERDGDYFGPAVNRAARIMSAGHGGQTLVSLATEELVRDRLPEGATLVDLGEHSLRGLSRKERLFQLNAWGLGRNFAPLRAADQVSGNLPRPLTSFVGRAEEMKHLVAELGKRRLITLTGSGGVGKTRLALEAAWLAAQEYPAGAWLVELAPAESRAVPALVAETLRITPQMAMSPTASIVDALAGRRTLVIVDNAEHVLDAAAELAGQIVSACDGVTVVVTSREPLGIAGERIWPVQPLNPVLEGVELFHQRADAVDGAYVWEDRDTVEALCVRLDGIPLAIELAAARARSMSPRDMLARLDNRFRLLRGTGRGRAERHQTLQAAVDWSYQLLADNERRLFDRLAVFAGTFDLAAAEALCADQHLDTWDVDDLLRVLVDKSMVVAHPTPDGTRYHLLETLRQYAKSRLADRGELQQLEDRHIAHYLTVAKQAQLDYEGTANAAGRARFEAEWENLRAAARTALTRGDVAGAEALVGATYWYAFLELRHEHREWAVETLRLPGASARVHGIVGLWGFGRLPLTEILHHGQDGVAAAPHPDHADTALCWLVIGDAHWYLGDPAQTRPAMLQYLRLAECIGDPWIVAHANANVASLLAGFDNATANETADRARRVAEELGNPSIGAYVAWALAATAAGERRFDDALQWNRRAAALAESSGNRFVAALATVGVALVGGKANREPHLAHAEALQKLYANRDWLDIWLVVDSLALLWADSGQAEPAAVLLGHLDAHNIRYPVRARRRADATRALEKLPEAAAWLAHGAQLDRHALVAYALHVLNESRSP